MSSVNTVRQDVNGRSMDVDVIKADDVIKAEERLTHEANRRKAPLPEGAESMPVYIGSILLGTAHYIVRDDGSRHVIRFSRNMSEMVSRKGKGKGISVWDARTRQLGQMSLRGAIDRVVNTQPGEYGIREWEGNITKMVRGLPSGTVPVKLRAASLDMLRAAIQADGSDGDDSFYE